MAALIATYHPNSCNTVAIPSILYNLTNIDLKIFVNKHFKRSSIHNAGFNQERNHFKIYMYARLVIIKRACFICAHTWIFFKLNILITQYIQAMERELLNQIIKNWTQEATLTYSHHEVIPVSKFVCPKSKALLIPRFVN